MANWVHSPHMDTREPGRAQDPVAERLRLARLTASDRNLREIGKAAEAIGISRQSLSRYEEGERQIPLEVVLLAAKVYGTPVAQLIGAEIGSPGPHMVAEATTRYTVARSFSTEAEKISYTIGVLDMANVAKSELSRCLDTAMAALLSPLTAPAPVVPGPTVAELVAKHADATRAAPATTAARAPAAAKVKGRR